MLSVSNVQIHVTTSGGVVMDEVINCAENRNSPAIIHVQTFPPNEFTEIYNAFLELPVEFTITGFLVIPPPNALVPYSITHHATQPVLPYHPTNPSFFSIINNTNLPIYLSHGSPNGPLTYRFIWI